MNTHRNVVFTAQVYRDWAALPGGRLGLRRRAAVPHHRLIGHIAVSFLSPLPLVLAYRFEPQVVLDACSSTGRRARSARSRR
jgi:long-chain acyl-CoA synthetase